MKPTKVSKGDTFGNFTVIKEVDKMGKNRRFLCKCNLCGREKAMHYGAVVNGGNVGCGCLKINFEWFSSCCTPLKAKHPKLYAAYKSMIYRCYKPNYKRYSQYGGRGISVSKEWYNNFPSFVNWAILNGFEVGLTLDRIDVNRGYSPSNCRWATLKEQNMNKQNTLWVLDGNKKICLAEFAEKNNVCYSTAFYRYKKGYSAQEIANGVRLA